MKRLIIAMIFPLIVTFFQIYPITPSYEIKPTYPDYSRPYGSAGSQSNPYQVREGYDGNIEIRTKYPDYNQPYGSPVSPSNPFKVVPVR
jgi:hypothetical protein